MNLPSGIDILALQRRAEKRRQVEEKNEQGRRNLEKWEKEHPEHDSSLWQEEDFNANGRLGHRVRVGLLPNGEDRQFVGDEAPKGLSLLLSRQKQNQSVLSTVSRWPA